MRWYGVDFGGLCYLVRGKTVNQNEAEHANHEGLDAIKSIHYVSAQLHVAIREMDDAQRHRMDITNGYLKEISRWTQWCAAAGMVYLISVVIHIFK